MKTTTSPAARDLEAAAAAAAEAKTAAAQQAPAASKVLAEAGAGEQEDRPAALRWAFMGRVYAMLSLQFALAAVFAAAAWLVPAVPRFFAHGPRAAVWPTSVAVLASPLVVMSAMLIKLGGREELKHLHPTNYALFGLSKLLLLDLFTLCCSVCIAVSAFSGAAVIFPSCIDVTVLVLLQATILTVLGLILFAFWAAKRGYDYIYTFSSMLTGLIVVLVYYIIEIPFPLVMVAVAICGLLVTLVFFSFIVIVLDGLGDVGGDGAPRAN